MTPRDVVKVLLAKSADITAKNRNKRTALMLAAAKGYGDIVKLLIKAGAME